VDSTNEIMTAMTAMASFGVAVFFLRFWRQTHERLFAYFAAAFCLLGTNWTVLAGMSGSLATRHLVYLIRLAAFIVIIVAIIDKNRAVGDRER
jgi:hypothetical protein